MKSKLGVAAILVLTVVMALSNARLTTSAPPPKEVSITNWPNTTSTVRSFKAWRLQEWDFDERQIVNVTYTAGYSELAMSAVVWARNVTIIISFHATNTSGIPYETEIINLVQDVPQPFYRTYTVKGSYLYFGMVNLNYDADPQPWSFSFDFYLTS